MNYVYIQINKYLELIREELGSAAFREDHKLFSRNRRGLLQIMPYIEASKIHDILVATETEACFLCPGTNRELYERITDSEWPLDPTHAIIENPSKYDFMWYNSVAAPFWEGSKDTMPRIILYDELDTYEGLVLYDMNALSRLPGLGKEETESVNKALALKGILMPPA